MFQVNNFLLHQSLLSRHRATQRAAAPGPVPHNDTCRLASSPASHTQLITDHSDDGNNNDDNDEDSDDDSQFASHQVRPLIRPLITLTCIMITRAL